MSAFIKLRIESHTLATIEKSAALHGMSRASFIIAAAKQAAENILCDQVYIQVNLKTHSQFLALLDKPGANEGYKHLMNTPRPWKL